jgi:hypothetical protein
MMLTDHDQDPIAAANALDRARDAERALADFYPRVLELEGLLADARAREEVAMAEARAKIAELEVLLAEARAAVDHLIEEAEAAHAETAAEHEKRLFAEYHVGLIQCTRAFRYLNIPRRLYGVMTGKKDMVHPYKPY